MKILSLKALLMLALAVCFTTVASAQISVGGKLGMNLASVSGSDKADDTKMVMCMAIGAIGNYTLTEMFSVQAELNYEGKGVGMKDFSESGNGWTSEQKNSKVKLGYLTIPILAKATFGNGTKFFVNAGPYFGFLMSAKSKGDYTYTSTIDPSMNQSDSYDEDVKKYYKGFDFGVLIGGGAIFPINDDMDAIADLRYNMGLSKLGDEGDAKVFNSVIGINIGVIYKLPN